ncbi:hypothetical protein ACFMPD_09920 [Sedimentitalea sp. HM32M-2]|uniref:hypothetical protein n=1 Tax=Sedimentitalea sp. HM32M-2 TaxID=3351566 RepID=UPI00362A19C2
MGVALTACAQDREQSVRGRLERWLVLGETAYFKSTIECTAAAFAVQGPEIRETITVVRTIRKGVRLLRQGTAVAFDVPGVDPSRVSEAIMALDLPDGLGVITAGVAAKDCMTETVAKQYAAALTDPDTVLFYDPQEKTLSIFDRSQQRVYFTRGSI